MNERVEMEKSKFHLSRTLSTSGDSRLGWANLLGFSQGLSMVVVVVIREGRGKEVEAFLKTSKELVSG